MRDDLGGLADLLHGAAQFAYDPLVVHYAELNEVDGVAHEQTDVVEWIVELMGDASGDLAERGELSRLDELLLFVAQLLFTSLHLGRRLLQISHDMNHGLAAGLKTQLVLVGILKDVRQSPPRIVEPLRLAGKSSSVLLVVGQDVKYRLPLVGETLIERVQVSHDVKHRAPLLVAFSQAALQRLHSCAEPADGRVASHRLHHSRLKILYDVLRHCDQALPAFSLSTSFRRLSSSFSRAIIFNSRPTTTSSNFSRSKIFS